MQVLSIRESVLQALVCLFKEQNSGLPNGLDAWGNPNSYDFTWSVVQREPLMERESNKKYALAIIETDEQKSPQIQTTHAFLQVTLEFTALLNVSDVPSTCASMILTNMQRKIREDITLGGIAVNVNETGNTIDVDNYTDKIVNGAMFISVMYKHAIDDPRRYV